MDSWQLALSDRVTFVLSAPERGAETVNLLLRVLALATVLLGSGCASLSIARPRRSDRRAGALDPGRLPARRPLHRTRRCGRWPAGRSPNPPRAAPLRHPAGRGEGALVARLNLLQRHPQHRPVTSHLRQGRQRPAGHRRTAGCIAAQGKVRVLIDQPRRSPTCRSSALSGAHQNFQLRVYNPTFGKARLNYFDYAGSVLCCFRRFNQRMHNKAAGDRRRNRRGRRPQLPGRLLRLGPRVQLPRPRRADCRPRGVHDGIRQLRCLLGLAQRAG